MSLTSLENLPIGVTAEEILAAFAPFIDNNAGMTEWRRALWKRRRRALRRAIERMRGRTSRDTPTVREEYKEAWSSGYGKYDIAAGPAKAEPWIFRRKPIMAGRLGAARFRSVILGATLRTLKPKSVLEVGCGDGINLLLLANAFPDIAFTGLELTDIGHQAAVQIQRHPRLPDNLRTYAPLPQVVKSGFRQIRFVQGDASAMPFARSEFDLVLTVLSIEQMEHVRDRALAEITRVTGEYMLNLEPFAEANRSFWRRLTVYGKDYFTGEVEDLQRYRLDPLWASDDFPQDTALGTLLVLSRKRPAS